MPTLRSTSINKDWSRFNINPTHVSDWYQIKINPFKFGPSQSYLLIFCGLVSIDLIDLGVILQGLSGWGGGQDGIRVVQQGPRASQDGWRWREEAIGCLTQHDESSEFLWPSDRWPWPFEMTLSSFFANPTLRFGYEQREFYKSHCKICLITKIVAKCLRECININLRMNYHKICQILMSTLINMSSVCMVLTCQRDNILL